MRSNKVLLLVSTLIITLSNISISNAQTIYESDQGFFTPVIESLYLRGGIFENTQLIGPAIGYRFNNRYDVSLHTEFLFSELKYSSSNNPTLSILNLGIKAGQTNQWNNGLLLRNELSAYHSFNLNHENYQGIKTPALTSILWASSLYKSLSISEHITLMPNVGVLAGLGDYQPPVSTANLRQGFDGFTAGPQLGLDTKFKLGKSFSITAKPQYRLRYNLTHEHSTSTLTFNVFLNF